MSGQIYTQSATAESSILLWTGQTSREFRIAESGMYLFLIHGLATNLTLHLEARAGERWIPLGLDNSHTIRRQNLARIGSTNSYQGSRICRLPAGTLRIRSSDVGASPEVRIAGAGIG